MYWQTSLIALSILLLCFIIAGLINHKFCWVNTFNLVLIALLSALSVILTNIIGYSQILFGKQIELGNFLILIIGMLFGPWAAIVGGITSDLLGDLIFIGGTFHLGFMLSKIIFGLSGCLIFSRFFSQWWRIKLWFLCIIAILIQMFFIHPLSLYGTIVNDWQTLWARFLLSIPNKIITFSVEAVVYPLLSFVGFRVLYLLYNTRPQSSILWSDRYQKVSFSFTPQLKTKALKKQEIIIDENIDSRG